MASSSCLESDLLGKDGKKFIQILQDPDKRALILQLLSTDKKESSKCQNKNQYESPSALMRRKQLEEKNKANEKLNNVCKPSRSESPVAFNKLLSGVVAFVDVHGKNGDMSAGVKNVMKSMGATVEDTFSYKTTHVIYKDGAYSTYEKAKMLKVPMVSVLWLEAIKESKKRVSEKKYPAFGLDKYEMNASKICEDMYKEIVQDELQRSLTKDGVPSTVTRRKKTNLPKELHLNKKSNTKLDFASDSDANSIDATPDDISPLTDSDLEAPCINGVSVKNITKAVHVSMELTCEESDKNNCISTSEDLIPGTQPSPKPESAQVSQCKRISSTQDLSPLIISESFEKNDKETCPTNLSSLRVSKGSSKKHSVTTEEMSSLRVSSITNSSRVSIETRKTRSSQSRRSSKNKTEEFISENNADETSHQHANKSENNTGRRTRSFSNKDKENISNKEESQESVDFENNIDEASSEDNSSLDRKSNKRNSTNKDRENEINDTESIRRNSGSLNKRKSKNSDLLNFVQRRSLIKNVENILKDSDDSNKPLSNVTKRKRKTNVRSSTKYDETDSDDEDEVPLRKRRSSRGKKSIESEESENSTADKEVSKDNTNLNGHESSSSSSVTHSTINETEITNEVIEETDNIDKSIESNKETNLNINNRSSPKILKENTGENLTQKDSEEDSRKRKVEGASQDNTAKDISTKKSKTTAADINENSKNMVRSKMHPVRAYMELVEKGMQDDPFGLNIVPTRKCRKLYNGDVAINPDTIPIRQRKNRPSSNIQVFPKTPVLLTSKVNKLFKSKPDVTSAKPIFESTSPPRFKPPEIQPINNKIKEQQEIKNKPKETIKSKTKETKSKTLHEKVKKKKVNEVDVTQSSNQSVIPIEPIIRRSTMDFVNIENANPKKSYFFKSRDSTIVCTMFHRDQERKFNKIVEELGVFRTELNVSTKTSHLVLGERKRTLNLLRAISRGCWILEPNWLHESLRKGRWLPEEDFEVTDFFPGIQKCRRERQAFGSSYVLDIFKDIGRVYIDSEISPQKSIVLELVKLCKGIVTTKINTAKIIISNEIVRNECITVTPQWVMESITQGQLKPFAEYAVKLPESPVL